MRAGDPEGCKGAMTWRQLVVREELDGSNCGPHKRLAGFLSLFGGVRGSEGCFNDSGLFRLRETCEHT